MSRASLKQRDDVEGCKEKGEIVHIRANVHLSHTRLQVEAAFPILLSISASNERLSVMVEPRKVNWQRASSS